MFKRKFMFMFLTAAIAASFNTFGSTPDKIKNGARLTNTKKCLFPKSRKRAPDWVCNAQADNLAVTAVGKFSKSAAGTEFMQQMAAADARAQLAQKLRESVQTKITESETASNKISTERDRALISKITDERLQGTKILKSVYGPKGTLYVLIGFDDAGMKILHESITADYMKQMQAAD